MFRQLAECYVDQTGASPWQYATLAALHARDILAVIEHYWQGSLTSGSLASTAKVKPKWTGNTPGLTRGDVLPRRESPPEWDHLIYAYLVENTRIHEIFRRVIVEYRTGESLGPLDDAAVQWLRTTEELFFTPKHTVGLPIPVASVVSPDWDAARRNAYYRMFGYDLNHSPGDASPSTYVKPAAANREFGNTLESLLHEVWKGITNADNASGPKETDDSQMANLASMLGSMLRERKMYGKLGYEEYWAVVSMSWLHMALRQDDSPILKALKAGATTEDESLRRIGQLVGVAPHAKSHDFLKLARNMSIFLRCLEAGNYADSVTAQALYHDPTANLMKDIISQYSVATGRDIKAKQVEVTPGQRVPLQARAAVR